MIRVRFGWLLGLLLLSCLPVAARAQVAASLVSTQQSVQPGQRVTVALRLQHQPGWHSFWERAGTGLPTRIDWRLPPGWHAGAIQWPVPILVHNTQGEVSGYGYEGLAFLPVELAVPAGLANGQSVELRATASWLMCRTLCIPGRQEVSLRLPVSVQAPLPDAEVMAQLASLPMPEPATGWTLAASRDRRELTVHVAAPGAVGTPYFFSLDKFVDYRQPQTIANRDTRAMLKMALDPDEAMPDDARLRGAADDGRAVCNHHVERDAQRIGHAVQHHADGVADDDHVGHLVDPLRHRRGVGGERHEAADAFGRTDRGDGLAGGAGMGAHERKPCERRAVTVASRSFAQ